MIYFCIPVHNEEKTVGVVLWKIRQVMADFPRDYQILAADDGSTDGTAKSLEPYRRVLPLIHMRSNESRGYAASLEMLLREVVRRSRYPRRDIAVIMQADLTDDAEDAPALLRKMESGADMAVGGPVSVAGHTGTLERLSTRLARRMLRRRDWPEPLSDPLHGFSALRLTCIRRALDGLDNDRLLQWEGLAANAALFAAVTPHARRIEAVPMTRYPERLQRPRRIRRLAMLKEVRRFVRGQGAPGIMAVEQLVPDEVHGDLSALRHERGRRKTERGRSRPPRAQGEQQGERPRKDGRPRRPRRRPPASESETEETVVKTGASKEGDGPGRKRRGSRGGARSRKKRQTPAEADAAGTEPPTASASGEPRTTNAGSGTAPEASGGAPKKRRRRGRRGGSRRRSGGAKKPDDKPSGSPDGKE